MSGHRKAVTDVAYGHIGRQNVIAVSVARDGKCIVWSPQEGMLLHTFLLASTPLCLALDPADRAAFIGFSDGTIQCIDFYEKKTLVHPFSDQNGHDSLQSKDTGRWSRPNDDSSPVNCIAVSYDGTIVLSGHENGKINSWNVGGGKHRGQLADFAAPITNIAILTPTGFLKIRKPPLKLHQVTKPKYESFSNSTNGTRTQSHSVRAQLVGHIEPSNTAHPTRREIFHNTLASPTFPDALLYASLSRLRLEQRGTNSKADSQAVAELNKTNAALAKELEDTKRALRMQKLEGKRRRQDDVVKAQRKRRRREREGMVDERERRRAMGEPVVDDGEGEGAMEVDEAEVEEEGELSSDTDELDD